MKISIIENYHLPIAKTIKEKTYYSQLAFINKGGPFPEQFEIPLDAPINAYPIGDNYRLTDDSFTINQYGTLELNRFRMKLERIAVSKSNDSK